MKTAQEIFDTVLNHLRKQGVASAVLHDSVVGAWSCCYRQGSLSCAVGCLIADEAYTPEMEGEAVGVGDGEVLKALLKSGVNGYHDGDLLTHLQIAHDSHMPKEEGHSMLRWEESMQGIAQQHKLLYREPV
jgi:hypothetical protein